MSTGRLTADELSERLESTYAAKTFQELERLVADLPDAERPLGGHALSRHTGAARPRGSHVSFALIGNVERTGSWVLPRMHVSFCYLGNVVLDLRQARFASQHATISVLALLGSVRIVVPSDLAVRVSGVGVVGGFRGAAAEGVPEGPSLHVTGLALWSEVAVVRAERAD